MSKRIAYFVGDFPSKTETWVCREIMQLMQEDVTIKNFSIRDKKPSFFLSEYSTLVKNTEYRDKFFFFHFLKALITSPNIFYRILNEIWGDFLNDTQGLRGKMQVLKDLMFFSSMLYKLNAFKPELVVVHFANARANHALFYNILSKTPYIIKMHAIDVFRRTNLFRLKVERAYKILTISNYNINFIKNRDRDVDTSKFTIHHCGIPIDMYQFKSVSAKNNKVPTILSVARLTAMKGFDTLIKASYELHKKNVPHKVIIVGFGPDKDMLVNLTKSLGIQDKIDFKDYCSPEEVKDLLHSSDLFALISRFDNKIKTQDGVPVALMEAMATGLPVVSTYISGIPELIDDGVNGFLVKPDDPVMLSNKIEQVLKMSKEELQAITDNARQKIEKCFNLTKLTDELKDLFKSVGEEL
jgi:colanic acid/amylovoran biosynthesis glycosyltransferase